MKTYKHKTNGTIATYKDGVFKQGRCCVEIGCEPSSEYWEEVIFITTDGVPIFKNDTYFVPQRVGSEYTSVLELPAEIRSKNDLSKTFSTKERANDFIKEYNECVKKPILITEDGVDIFEGDDYYYVSKEKLNIVYVESSDKRFDSKKEGLLDFKYKSNAEEYILINKPLLSLNDLLSVWATDGLYDVYKESPMFQNFKNLAKTKL